MAARIDLIYRLRDGLSCEEVAELYKCSLAWVEIVAGKRIPESATPRKLFPFRKQTNLPTLARAA